MMERGFTQVTPENAQRLVDRLNALAKQGEVLITSGGMPGGDQPLIGRRIEFLITDEGDRQMIVGMRPGTSTGIPISPIGVKPKRRGDAIAWCKIDGNIVRILYRYTRGRGWRRLTFSAS